MCCFVHHADRLLINFGETFVVNQCNATLNQRLYAFHASQANQ